MRTLIRRLLGRARLVWVAECADCTWRHESDDDEESRGAMMRHSVSEGHFTTAKAVWR